MIKLLVMAFIVFVVAPTAMLFAWLVTRKWMVGYTRAQRKELEELGLSNYFDAKKQGVDPWTYARYLKEQRRK